MFVYSFVFSIPFSDFIGQVLEGRKVYFSFFFLFRQKPDFLIYIKGFDVISLLLLSDYPQPQKNVTPNCVSNTGR